jgi:hypothetical protein
MQGPRCPRALSASAHTPLPCCSKLEQELSTLKDKAQSSSVKSSSGLEALRDRLAEVEKSVAARAVEVCTLCGSCLCRTAPGQGFNCRVHLLASACWLIKGDWLLHNRVVLECSRA